MVALTLGNVMPLEFRVPASQTRALRTTAAITPAGASVTNGRRSGPVKTRLGGGHSPYLTHSTSGLLRSLQDGPHFTEWSHEQ